MWTFRLKPKDARTASAQRRASDEAGRSPWPVADRARQRKAVFRRDAVPTGDRTVRGKDGKKPHRLFVVRDVVPRGGHVAVGM